MEEPPRSRREQQAERTRDDILRAARRLFAERGYARTSVRDVAKAAAVSAQTVYDSVGSKRALVIRLNDLIDQEAGVPALARAVATSDDPLEIVSGPARITRSILEHCGDVVRALVTGAAAEPDLAAALADAQRRHHGGATMVVGRLADLGALSATVEDHPAAVDTLAFVADIRGALVMEEGYGWSYDRIESWIGSTSATLLLAAPP